MVNEVKDALIQTNIALEAQKSARTKLNGHIEMLNKHVRSLIHQLADEPVFVFEHGGQTYICNNGTVQKVLRL